MSFIITFLIIFFTFIINKRSFIWNSDASGQYLPNLYEVYHNFSNFLHSIVDNKMFISLSEYSFSAGVGTDITANYFTGLLEYIGFFFTRKNIEYTFSVIIVLRLYLSGICFGIMTLFFDNKNKYIIPGALLYAFNGFTLYYGMRHASFLIPMAILPLLIIGVEKNIKTSFEVTYQSNYAKGNLWLLNSNDKYRLSNYQDYIVYHGTNQQKDISYVALTLPFSGEYKYDDISIYSISRDNYVKKISSDNSMYNIKYTNEFIEGDINAQYNGMLLLSIPYNKNWNVYIDGQQTDIILADYMWIAIRIDKGEHHITIKYRNMLLHISAYILLIGIISTIIILIVREKHNVH
ncbi:MAG: YfhO family protein [Lachnospiraceae bacterium]|nr:YfhO family protein [Lachnospiraceae bacterium]